MTYIPNPKLKGSNIVACVPQDGFCPIKCTDCFFNRPENYLGEAPRANMPSVEETKGKIVRVNDVNDSSNDRARVLGVTRRYKDRFYNTAELNRLEEFEYPVVLTANPGIMTDTAFWRLPKIPKNLMFVRARVNTWNLLLIDNIVEYYTGLNVSVVLTYMAYYETPIPKGHEHFYAEKVRTLNRYWCVRDEVWYMIFQRYADNDFVVPCGNGPQSHLCRDCGVCEDFYVDTIARLGLETELVI